MAVLSGNDTECYRSGLDSGVTPEKSCVLLSSGPKVSVSDGAPYL